MPEQAQIEEPVLDILPDNRETVYWFLRMQRRWVVDAAGCLARLDESALRAMMDMDGVRRRKRAQLLDELMVMESSVLEFLHEKSDG